MSKDFCFNNTIHTTFNNSLLKDGATGATTINTMIPCTNPNNTITIQPIDISIPNTSNTGNPFVNWAPSSSSFSGGGSVSSSSFTPHISIPTTVRTSSGGGGSYTTSSSHEAAIIQARNANIMKGFTGQVLGGATHEKRHCRNYEKSPTVNKEVYAAMREIDSKGHAKAVNFILFHNCYLEDADMCWLSDIFNTHTPKGLSINTLDLSNNCLTNVSHPSLPFFNSPRYIQRLDLSNNQIGDKGAKLIADGLANGVLPITKMINLSGNKISKEGHKSLMTALDSPKVKSVMVALVQNISSFYDKSDKAVKATIDFVTKGLKYTIDEHNKGLKGTKWDSTTVRTDSMDKWKNCKEVGQNVQKGFIGGLIKCMPLAEAPPAMFACAGQQAGLELLDPDTFWCIAEINKFVDETEVIGDCTIF